MTLLCPGHSGLDPESSEKESESIRFPLLWMPDQVRHDKRERLRMAGGYASMTKKASAGMTAWKEVAYSSFLEFRAN